MKKHNIITFLCYVVSPLGELGGLVSCRSHDVVVERLVQRDTIYQDRTQYDSVFVEHNVFQDRSSDTILIREKEIEVRYRLKHDSIYIARVDSIPYEVRITKREEIPKWKKWLNWISYASLLFSIFVIWKRLTS